MDRFKHFLIRRNLYAKFSNNLKRLKKVDYGDWIRTKQSWTFPKLIIHAFSWRNTPEGYIFWQEIMELSRIYEF